MTRQRPSNDATPGTGKQVVTIASPPCTCRGELPAEECDDVNHEQNNTFRFRGTTYKVGHDYLDTVIQDVAELAGVYRVSGPMSAAPPEEGFSEFHMVAERYGSYVIRPIEEERRMSRTNLNYRLTERYTSDPPLGAPAPPY